MVISIIQNFYPIHLVSHLKSFLYFVKYCKV